ncbi:MAG TPA: DUF1178 family protein [Candidatus Aphodousia faecigallinarum]|uniref:DUF1178 family protein n=1 Tax=Candidatus Aphodousia faecigallinarum TaxID=2840677 RepID=A0A9D1LEM1_9BURK|nr:DUF1178 family protein [Candidatus Aphodousia faecigallinarum]
MKVFNCVCEFGHQFEGWFDSVESLDEQIAQGLVTCPYCETTNVKRVPTASYVLASRDKEKTQYTERELEAEVRSRVYSAARKLLQGSENVGERFAQEARAVHQGKAPMRTIHGRCTLNEAEELLDEGINVLPLPDGVVHENN